nr:hypothetical protein [Tanacetum cinerariifolium]GEX38513.1 hypothetical protein [Tanacetum cinerariifolium]
MFQNNRPKTLLDDVEMLNCVEMMLTLLKCVFCTCRVFLLCWPKEKAVRKPKVASEKSATGHFVPDQAISYENVGSGSVHNEGVWHLTKIWKPMAALCMQLDKLLMELLL